MKSLLLAATVAAGLLITADTADAQYRGRRGVSYYSYPTYSYSYPSYSAPAYSYSYPSGYSTYYTPSYTYPTTSGYYYGPSYYTSPSYYNGGYYNNYVAPSGVYWGGRRIWGW